VATDFPGAIDSFTDPTPNEPMNSPSHSGQHTDANDAMVAVQTFIGTTTAPKFATTFNSRGPIAYSTTYNRGDLVIYYGRLIYFTTTVTTGAGTTGQPFISSVDYINIGSRDVFHATDFGVVGDNAVTDNWGALQGLMMLCWYISASTGAGYKIILPAGYIGTSKTLILPPQVNLIGQGKYATALEIQAGANCDVLQHMQYNSSSQSSLLGVTASTLRNAFFSGAQDLCIHGNNGEQTLGGYHYGINAQTNPLTSTGTGDPDFDPKCYYRNVYVRSCTGDGLYANGRSGTSFADCDFLYNLGNGITPSFDTQFSNCQSGFNGVGGGYFNHGSGQGAANKSYNNGFNAIWISGMAVYAGQLIYDQAATKICQAINSLASSTTQPSLDSTNFVVLPATSPQAWGTGIYLDSNSGEITAQWDCQENSASNFYLKGFGGSATGGGVTISGCSFKSNFVNVSNGTNAAVAVNTTNAYNYADLVLDGCSGAICDIAIGGNGAASYVLRTVNIATRNDVRIAGSTAGTFLTPDSLIGSPSNANSVTFNGMKYMLAQVMTSTYLLVQATYGNVSVTNYAASIMSLSLSVAGARDGQPLTLRIYDFSNVPQTLSWTNTENGPPVQSAGSTTLPLTLNFIFNGATGLWRYSNSNTSGSAAVATPTLGAAAQLAQTIADAMLYIAVGTAGTLTVAIGPTSGVATVIVNGLAAAIGDLYTVRLPAGWYIAVTTGTTAAWTATAITC
jgi:hypothetical protein